MSYFIIPYGMLIIQKLGIVPFVAMLLKGRFVVFVGDFRLSWVR